MAGEPVPDEMADERERDCVVAGAACLAGAAEAMTAPVRSPGGEGPAEGAGGTVAGDEAEITAGAL